MELYDHENDPGEYRNLADSPEYGPVVAEMRRLLLANWPEDAWTPRSDSKPD